MVNDEMTAWRENFLTLDDGRFLKIMRIYLGAVKTPYNKQKLIERLEGFLRREETQENIVAQLSAEDLEILSAVNFIPNATPQKLRDFFAGDYFAQAGDGLIQDLKSRFLLYNYSSGKNTEPVLKINPYLRSALEGVLLKKILFPEFSGAAESKSSEADCISAELVAAYIAYIAQNGNICKLDGSFKKRTEEDIKEKFPGQIEKLRLLTKAFVNLGLFLESKDALEPDWKKIKSFSRMDFVHAALYLLTSVSMRYNKQRTKFYSEVFYNALKSIPQKGFADKIFLRCAFFLATTDGQGNDFSGGAQSRFARIVQSHKQSLNIFDSGNTLNNFFERMLDNARTLGIVLCSKSNEHNERDEFAVWKNPLFSEEEIQNQSALSIDSASNVLLMPGLSLERLCELVQFMSLVKFDTAARYEITRESAVRAFDEGWTAAQICAVLKDNSNFALPDTLQFSLGEWENSYRSISLYKGYVLKFEGESAELLAGNPFIKKHIAVRLSEKVFLLDCARDDEVAEILREAGIKDAGRIVQLDSEAVSKGSAEFTSTSFPPLRERNLFAEEKSNPRFKPLKGDEREKFTQELFKKIDALEISDNQKNALRDFAAGKIIVNSSQLCEVSIPLEIKAAQGLDYEGKVHVIEAAIKNDERILFRLSKKSKLLSGLPVGIDRSNFEDGVYLNVLVGEEHREISIGKIEFVQRISGNIKLFD